MYKIIFKLILVTLLLNEAIFFPTIHQEVISEKIPTSRHPMMRRKICKVKFRLMPKITSSFISEFVIFKRPRVLCFWVKSEKKISKTASTTTKSPRISTTTQTSTTRMPKLCTFHIGFASLFNFCNQINLRT